MHSQLAHSRGRWPKEAALVPKDTFILDRGALVPEPLLIKVQLHVVVMMMMIVTGGRRRRRLDQVLLTLRRGTEHVVGGHALSATINQNLSLGPSLEQAPLATLGTGRAQTRLEVNENLLLLVVVVVGGRRMCQWPYGGHVPGTDEVIKDRSLIR